MEIIIIENLLALKDEIPLELRAQSDMEAIAKSVTAFINARGGSIILGIDGDKNIAGIEGAENEKKKIREYLDAYIKPLPPVSLDVINYMEKNVILLNTWMGAQKPYQYISTKEVVEGAVNGSFEGTVEGTKTKLIQLLLAIHQKPGMRVPDIEKVTGMPVKTLERYIKRLKEAHLIEFRGNSFQTGGYYSTIKN